MTYVTRTDALWQRVSDLYTLDKDMPVVENSIEDIGIKGKESLA